MKNKANAYIKNKVNEMEGLNWKIMGVLTLHFDSPSLLIVWSPLLSPVVGSSSSSLTMTWEGTVYERIIFFLLIHEFVVESRFLILLSKSNCFLPLLILRIKQP
jgi:hypothetical protein